MKIINKPMKKIILGLGQMAFGNPVGDWTCPEWIEGLLAKIIDEVERVYWNKNQKVFEEHSGTGMPKLVIRSYYWGEDKKEASKPNLKFKDVEVRWYKHFGRSMTLNVFKTEKQWIKWFNECMDYIRSFDIKDF